MAERAYQCGEIVYREGDRGDSFFRVLRGSVDVSVHTGDAGEKKLTTLGPGDFFGEMAVLAGSDRSGTVTAAQDDTLLLELTAADLETYLAEYPEMILDLIRLLGGRIRSLSREYEDACAALWELKSADAAPRNPTLLEKAKFAVSWFFGSKRDSGTLSEEARRAILSQQTWERSFDRVSAFPKGTILYREGEPGSCMYQIQWGSVGIYAGYGTDREQKLTDLSTNQFFGEMGLLDGEPRSATVIVLEDNTTLETITAADLPEIFRKNPSEIWMILDHTSRRLRRLTQDYADVCKEICERQGA